MLKGPLFPSLVDIPLLGPEGGFAFFSLILFARFFLLALKGKDLPEAWFIRAVRFAPIPMSAAWLPWGGRGALLPAPLLLLVFVLPPDASRGRFRLSPRLAFRVASSFIVSAMFLLILLARGNNEALAPKVLTDPFYTLGALGAGLALLRWFAVDLRSIYFFAQSLLVLGFAALGGGRPLIPLALLQLGFGTFGAYLFFTLLLYLGSRAGRSEALSVVSSIQAVNSGSLVLGMLLTRTTGCAAGLLEVPFVLAASLLGVGLLFFSALFLRDDPTSFAGFDLRGASEEEVPSKEAGAEHPREEAESEEREEGVFLCFMEQGLSLQEIRVALLVFERGYLAAPQYYIQHTAEPSAEDSQEDRFIQQKSPP